MIKFILDGRMVDKVRGMPPKPPASWIAVSRTYVSLHLSLPEYKCFENLYNFSCHNFSKYIYIYIYIYKIKNKFVIK